MPHDYNTKTKNQEDENNMSVAIANVKAKVLYWLASLKNNMINLMSLIIRNLEEENAKLKYEVEIFETKLNNLEQFGRRNDTKVSRIPNTVTKNEIKLSVISIMRANDTKIDDHNIGACYRIGKPKENSTKMVVSETEK